MSHFDDSADIQFPFQHDAALPPRAEGTANGTNGVSIVQFADLGLNDLAYVKRTLVDGARVWAVHAADGTPLTTLNTRETAFAAVRQHALDPVSVH